MSCWVYVTAGKYSLASRKALLCAFMSTFAEWALYRGEVWQLFLYVICIQYTIRHSVNPIQFYVKFKNYSVQKCSMMEAKSWTIYLFGGYNKDGDRSWTYLFNGYSDWSYRMAAKPVKVLSSVNTSCTSTTAWHTVPMLPEATRGPALPITTATTRVLSSVNAICTCPSCRARGVLNQCAAWIYAICDMPARLLQLAWLTVPVLCIHVYFVCDIVGWDCATLFRVLKTAQVAVDVHFLAVE